MEPIFFKPVVIEIRIQTAAAAVISKVAITTAIRVLRAFSLVTDAASTASLTFSVPN